MRNHWVLDGVGSITGTRAGQSYGTNREILPELRPLLAKDGVHLNDMAGRNVTSIIDVFSRMGTGKLVSGSDTGTGTDTGTDTGSSPNIGISDGRGKSEYFWRGYSSSIGDTVGRAKLAASGSRMFNERPNPGGQGGQGGQSGRQMSAKGGRQFHPYGRKNK
jgi:hypothetical protein